MKIVTIVGARPQFIKAAAVSRKLRQYHQEILVHTGQHYDANMSDVFFEEMEIPRPDYNLHISGGSHAQMTGNMLIAIEKVLVDEQPDALLVYGDTNSTVAGALAAVKLHIPIIHVESGNRLGTLDNPEEVNRILTDHMSTLCLSATETGRAYLEKEGLGDKSYVVGNIMFDSFLHFAEKTKDREFPIDDYVTGLSMPTSFYYLTCHRQENTYSDEPLIQILGAMNELDSPVIYPVHPRNKERAERICKMYQFNNVILLPPVKYSDSVWLTLHAKKIVTDSGGLQCEAFFAGVQCLTIFDHVVWPETMVSNRNQLCRPDKKEILDKMNTVQQIDQSYLPFGDGYSADKIIDFINKYVAVKER